MKHRNEKKSADTFASTQYIRDEYHFRHKDSLRYEKEISLLFNNLKTLISHSDLKQLQKYLQEQDCIMKR